MKQSGIKFAIKSGVLVLASALMLTNHPPMPVIGFALCFVLVFARRWTSFYTFLNLFVICAIFIYAILVEPSLIYNLHPSKWVIVIVVAPCFFLALKDYRSDCGKDNS